MPARTKVLPVTTTSAEARGHFELGREAAFHWNVAQAHRLLDAAIAADPEFVLAYLHRAGTSRPDERRRYFDRAETSLERVTPAERHMVDAFRAFLLEDDYDRAVDILEGLCAEYPDDHHLRGYLGLRFYMNLQRYDQAVEQFERALQLNPRWPQAHNFLGHVALARGDHAAAEEAFRRYLELAPDQPQAFCSLGDLFRSLGRHAEAADYYERVLERDPDFFGGWIRPGWMRDVLAWTYVEGALYEEAERAMRDNIRLHPAVAHNHDSLGRLYLQLGRHGDAAAQFAAALKLDPGSTATRERLERARAPLSGPDADVTSAQKRLLPITTVSEEARRHFERGRTAAHHYQFAEAREHLDSAIAADPSFVLAHLHRGGSARFRSELRDHLDRAAENRELASPGEQQMIDAFRAFLLERNYGRAVEIFHKLSDEYPDDPYLPAYLGFRYYRNLRRYDEAAQQFRRALERDPSFVQAHNWLGCIAMDQGDYDAAEEAFRRYLRLAPGLPRPYDSLGVLYLRRRRYEEAAAQFEEALARDPRFTESRDNLARAHIMPAKESLEESFARREATAVAARYTEDGQLLPAGSTVIEGGEAIERYWQAAFDAGLTGAGFETVEVYSGADADTATEVGRYRFTAGDQEVDAGKYVVIWQRTPDGWLLHRHVWTTDRGPGK